MLNCFEGYLTFLGPLSFDWLWTECCKWGNDMGPTSPDVIVVICMKGAPVHFEHGHMETDIVMFALIGMLTLESVEHHLLQSLVIHLITKWITLCPFFSVLLLFLVFKSIEDGLELSPCQALQQRLHGIHFPSLHWVLCCKLACQAGCTTSPNHWLSHTPKGMLGLWSSCWSCCLDPYKPWSFEHWDFW